MHNGNVVDVKVKDFKKSFVSLYKYAKPFMKLVMIAIILAVVSSILSLVGPNQLSEITNTIVAGIMTGIDLDKVKSIFLLLVCLYSCSLIFGYLQGFMMATVTQKFSKKLRNEIIVKINKLPLKYFDGSTYGDILSRVTNDVDTISQSLNQSLGTLVSSVTLFIGSIIMMFFTNYIMAITAIISSLLGFSLMTIILSKSQKYFLMQQKELGALNGHIEEIYSGHNVIKAYNAMDEAKGKFDKINNNLFFSARKSQFLSGLMMPIMGFVGNFGYLCVCIVGALLVMNDTISVGTIISFTIYVRLFTQPLSQIAQSMASIQATAAASERVFEFLDEKELADEKDKKGFLDKDKIEGNITFSDVRFGYNEDKEIIKGFSASVKSGQKVAIVGPTGAGKTTLVNLLMKFYEVNSGDIKIDNVSINDLTRENIHDLFCMVLQDTWVYNGTIKENIVYNQTKVTNNDVKEACKTVGLSHFINTLPNGYDTVINDEDNLSAGEKQLLTIARGMVKKAPLLILDEATSSVDTRTEELVQKAMDKLTEGKTSFIIAHRLSTIKNADLILVLRDGNIIEQGNHEELLKLDGFYADLYNSQFEEA
ncbi:MAG: ABC transporter ATP-binding protein [Bacilli bacterium]|nr:ABC transporter ATP-binding protein [Bacilli bacterium]